MQARAPLLLLLPFLMLGALLLGLRAAGGAVVRGGDVSAVRTGRQTRYGAVRKDGKGSYGIVGAACRKAYKDSQLVNLPLSMRHTRQGKVHAQCGSCAAEVTSVHLFVS